MKSKKQTSGRKPNKKNIKAAEELKKLIETKKTIMIASIKNLPASQFQEIGKKLRNKAIVKVPKKNLIFMALESSGKEEVKKIQNYIQESVAVLFSDLDAFELASELLNNKTPAKAKAGQEAPEDIEIPAGPTDLMPGPAISELGSLRIQIQIEKGKISIKEPKVIVKKGEKISQNAAEIMSKLDIKPFSIGFLPLCAFDKEEGKFYSELKIDREGTLKELRTAFGKALPFAVEIGYSNEDTITFLIRKAGRHEKILDNSPEKEIVNKNSTEKSGDINNKSLGGGGGVDGGSESEDIQTPENKSEEENK